VGAPGEIRYARSEDGVDIAYSVWGDGPIDLVLIGGFITHLDLMWDFPWYEPFIRWGQFARVIAFDKRGTGLSDRSLGFGSLEERSEDIHTVMDAAGSERAVIHGISEGGPMALYFAARYPERVHGLILYGTAARFARAPDYPDGISPAVAEDFVGAVERNWGTGAAFGFFVQHPDDPEAAARRLAPYERSACTRQMARHIMERNLDMDVRPVLPTVSAPALVMHCRKDPVVSVVLARSLAEHLPNASYVELDGDFHASWRPEDQRRFAGPITQFLKGLGVEPPRPPADRILATVLFTDIVGSTERVSGAGDRAWRDILDRHDQMAADRVSRFGGTLVKTTGDGLLATFGGPSSAIEAARAVRESVAGLDLAIRAGIHTGEVELRRDDVGGIAVHIGARIAALAGPGEILVSRTVKDLVTGSGLDFEDRAEHDLKGVPGSWQLYALSN
jgi:class 3 adenylate cyclase